MHGPPPRPFRYRDKGILATIGRTSAVGQVGPVTFTGFIGWIVWLVVHLYYLIGFENRIQVLLRWAWYYVHLDRPVRMVIHAVSASLPPATTRDVLWNHGGDELLRPGAAWPESEGV